MVSAAPPTTPAPSAKRRGVLLPVAGLVALALCALITIGIVERTIGPVGVLVGTLCAMLPVVPVVATFLWVDRWEPEPPRLLLAAFAWGAGLSALVALLINSSASAVLDAAAGRGAGDLLAPVVVAPIVEESVKGAFIVGLLIFRRKEFDGVVDGVVYAGVVAAGFAFTENILYLGRTVVDPETAGVLGTLFMRGVASPFAHPLFTCMIGIGAGVAVASRSVARRTVSVLVGFVVAVVLHALWNAASVLAATPATFFQVYVFVMLPLFVGLVVLVVFARRREAAVVTAELPGFAAAGWIAPSEVPLLADLSRRRGWRALVQRRSGRNAARAVAEYQAAVTELAFLRARIARGAIQASAAAEHDERVRAVLRARAKAVGMPDALTSAWRLPPPPGWQPPPPPEPDGSYTRPVRVPDGPYAPQAHPGPPPGAGYGPGAAPAPGAGYGHGT
ncbi:MAG: PrsW family intramembrane metalloprotease, partial [Actinomycetota bacterium]|nr:PrsW family intramembrane metalloprotease [Actinomycetota bacterium]